MFNMLINALPVLDLEEHASLHLKNRLRFEYVIQTLEQDPTM